MKWPRCWHPSSPAPLPDRPSGSRRARPATRPYPAPPPRLPAFQQRFPGVELRIETSMRAVQLQGSELDAALALLAPLGERAAGQPRPRRQSPSLQEAPAIALLHARRRRARSLPRAISRCGPFASPPRSRNPPSAGARGTHGRSPPAPSRLPDGTGCDSGRTSHRTPRADGWLYRRLALRDCTSVQSYCT